MIERAVLLGHGSQIGVAELGIDPAQAPAQAPARALDQAHVPRTEPPFVNGERSLSDQLDAVERQGILQTLEVCGGNQSEAARRLGISRGTLIARLARYGAPRPRPRRPAAVGS